MKTEKNILWAFLLNFSFSIFEFIGGILTGSVAILSDAVHDIGDSVSIGASYFFERRSKRAPDKRYTYGYGRYSVIGGLITVLVLIVGSAVVIYNAIDRIISPSEINYNGMIIFALVGVLVNFLAALFTREGDSINQKAVNLHMLEDVLGWLAVLIGAIVMRFTDFALLDPILSIAVAVFILINAIKGISDILDLLLEKAPKNIDVGEIIEHLEAISGVIGVHHVHLWSLSGESAYATLHIVYRGDARAVKEAVKEELSLHGVSHSTVELETEDEHCLDTDCHPKTEAHAHCHHHHHHH